MSSDQPLPKPTPETAPFWEGTLAGVLRLPRCTACAAVFFPPQASCPRCTSSGLDWITASGRGRVHSYVVSHLAPPGFPPPTVLALVDLDEGPRMLSRLVDGPDDPAAIVLDGAVEVVFEPHGPVSLPLFRLAGTTDGSRADDRGDGDT